FHITKYGPPVVEGLFFVITVPGGHRPPVIGKHGIGVSQGGNQHPSHITADLQFLGGAFHVHPRRPQHGAPPTSGRTMLGLERHVYIFSSEFLGVFLVRRNKIRRILGNGIVHAVHVIEQILAFENRGKQDREHDPEADHHHHSAREL